MERFGVSRPSLREALRILEAEGLISVVRGMLGGVVVHEPDQRMTARTAALVLQARNVSLADVYEARSLLEPVAVRAVASLRSRRSAVSELRRLIDAQIEVIMDPEAFGSANARFHEGLVALAGNRTLTIVAEMLNEIVAKAVTAASKAAPADSAATRRRGIRSQERLVSLIEAGKALRGRGALAHAHDGRRPRPARAGRHHRHRSHAPPLGLASLRGRAARPHPHRRLGRHRHAHAEPAREAERLHHGDGRRGDGGAARRGATTPPCAR